MSKSDVEPAPGNLRGSKAVGPRPLLDVVPWLAVNNSSDTKSSAATKESKNKYVLACIRVENTTGLPSIIVHGEDVEAAANDDAPSPPGNDFWDRCTTF